MLSIAHLKSKIKQAEAVGYLSLPLTHTLYARHTAVTQFKSQIQQATAVGPTCRRPPTTLQPTPTTTHTHTHTHTHT